MVQTQADQAKLSLRLATTEATRAALQKQINDWQKTADNYRSEPSSGEGQDQLSPPGEAGCFGLVTGCPHRTPT
jgi:hypothetical protein